MTSATRTRLDVAFPSAGDDCRAWLFMPDAERPPLVILGHGLGATREYGLEPYAQRFADAGIAALVFTYRHFGDSGGHPLVAAARDGSVAAVVSQCPFTDGIAATRAAHPRSLVHAVRLALRDQLGSLRGRPPVMVPFVGPPGSAALMASPDSEPGYRALVPPGTEFHNGRRSFLLHVGMHRPGRSAKKIKAPVLFCICDADAVAPAETALRYAVTAPRGEVKRYPVGHFDIYLGEPFQAAVRDQTEFLVRHLAVASMTTATTSTEIEGMCAGS